MTKPLLVKRTIPHIIQSLHYHKIESWSQAAPKRLPMVLVLLILIIGGMANSMPAQTNSTPPIAKKIAKLDHTHGESRTDNYYWLREKTNPEVIDYLKAENAYAEAMLQPWQPFQNHLYTEMVGRLKETDSSAPYRKGEYLYYSRTEQGKQYSIYCRKKGSLAANEEVLLDLNALAVGEKFIGLGVFEISPDGKKLAYSIDNTGFRQYKLYIKDLTAGQLSTEHIERVDSMVWAADSSTFCYVIEDDAKRPYQALRHKVGESQSQVIYEEKDALYTITISESSSSDYFLLFSESSNTSEWRYWPTNQPAATPQVVVARTENHQYSVDQHTDKFYILTNKDAKNFRLVTAPVSTPQVEHWQELIPHNPKVKLERIKLFAQYYVLLERSEGLPRVRITNLKDNHTYLIDFPDPVYDANLFNNEEFNTNTLLISYQSLVTPFSVFEYQMDKQVRQLVKQTEVLGYDPSQYQSTRVYATATDGTKVPISLLYKKGMKQDGTNPMFLNGYGAYGANYPIRFEAPRISLLDRGMIVAIAHIRGGGELGEKWYEDGKMMLKRNTFTDFINAAEFLLAQKYTASDRLVIKGRSAGGLLMGAVTNMRPELFKAVIAEVPFVDVVNTMLDESLPLTTGEFLEWGNPKVKNEYDYLKSYCPYTNIEAKDYPNILVKTSLNDSQVMYWEPAKYVAKLRATKTDHNLLIFKTNLAGGHGGSSGRYDALKDLAADYIFILSQVSITQ